MMIVHSDDEFDLVGHAKRISQTSTPKYDHKRKIEPHSTPDRRLTPSSKARLERDYRLAIREGSPSPLSRERKKVKQSPQHLIAASPSKSRSCSHSRKDSPSSAPSSNSNTPTRTHFRSHSSKSDSNKIQHPWSDAENVLLWNTVVKCTDGKIDWDEVEEIINSISIKIRSKSAVCQRWGKLRKEIGSFLDPTNSAGDIMSGQPQGRGRRRRVNSPLSDISSTPLLSRSSRIRHTSSSVKREETNE